MIGLHCKCIKLFRFKKNSVPFFFESGVYGHFMGSNPWAKCDKPCLPMMSILVGGRIKEVAVMNQLSSNLHFMMVCFFKITK